MELHEEDITVDSEFEFTNIGTPINQLTKQEATFKTLASSPPSTSEAEQTGNELEVLWVLARWGM